MYTINLNTNTWQNRTTILFPLSLYETIREAEEYDQPSVTDHSVVWSCVSFRTMTYRSTAADADASLRSVSATAVTRVAGTTGNINPAPDNEKFRQS